MEEELHTLLQTILVIFYLSFRSQPKLALVFLSVLIDFTCC